MSVFSTCEAGHDLTLPDAYITVRSGYRVCRECHYDRLPPAKRRERR